MWRKGRKQGWKEGLNRWKVGGGMEESLERMKDEAVRQKVIEKRQTDIWKRAELEHIRLSACFLLVPAFNTPLHFQHSHMSSLTFTMHSRWS